MSAPETTRAQGADTPPRTRLRSGAREAGAIPLVKPRRAEPFTADEARALVQARALARDPVTAGGLTPLALESPATTLTSTSRTTASTVKPQREPGRPIARQFASHATPHMRLANKLANFRPAEPLTAEELLLLHDVVPPSFAQQFTSFLADLRASPRMLTPGAIQNITNGYSLLKVCAVNTDPAPTAKAVEDVTWSMRYVTMPCVPGMSMAISVSLVVDTGAIVNCLSLAFYRKYAPLLHAQGVRSVQPAADPAATIVAVDSTQLAVQTVLLGVPFTIGGRDYLANFLLVDGLVATPFLLGGPWLHATSCDIHYSSNVLVLPPTAAHRRCELPFTITTTSFSRTGTLLSPPCDAGS